MSNFRYLKILFIGMSCLTISAPTFAQRQSTISASDNALPLCRQAEAGERCRTRNGTVRIRRGSRSGAPDAPTTNNLGTTDPGWEIRERPDTEEGGNGRALLREPRPDGFGGEDIGFAIGGAGDRPEPEAMECDFCDDDEDVPQGPIVKTPLPDEPTTSEPEEEEDCTWRNPAGWPDQEFCDE